MVRFMAAAAIHDFWAFWRKNCQAIAAAIEDGNLPDWTTPINDLVKDIDPDLDWEFGTGQVAEHYFCTSSKGDLRGRIVAERWLAVAPAADDIFEFHASRPGGGHMPDATLRFGEHEIALDDFRFAIAVDQPRRSANIRVWHPVFASCPDDLKPMATFIALDSVLGEDGVENWIGSVDLAESPLLEDAVPFPALVDAVEDVASTEAGLSLLQGELQDGSAIVVTAWFGLKRLDHIHMDQHIEVTLQLTEPNEHGLTTSDEGERLNAAEDALLELLGDNAIYIGHETSTGKRTIHFHIAGNGGTLECFESWAAQQPWTTEVNRKPDPEWNILRRW